MISYPYQALIIPVIVDASTSLCLRMPIPSRYLWDSPQWRGHRHHVCQSSL